MLDLHIPPSAACVAIEMAVCFAHSVGCGRRRLEANFGPGLLSGRNIFYNFVLGWIGGPSNVTSRLAACFASLAMSGSPGVDIISTAPV